MTVGDEHADPQPAGGRRRLLDPAVIAAPSRWRRPASRPSGATSSSRSCAAVQRVRSTSTKVSVRGRSVGGPVTSSAGTPAGSAPASFSVSAGVDKRSQAGLPLLGGACPGRPSQAVVNRAAVCSGVGSPGRGDRRRRRLRWRCTPSSPASGSTVVIGRFGPAAQSVRRVGRAGDQTGRADHAEDQHRDHQRDARAGTGATRVKRNPPPAASPSPRLGAHPRCRCGPARARRSPAGRPRTPGASSGTSGSVQVAGCRRLGCGAGRATPPPVLLGRRLTGAFLAVRPIRRRCVGPLDGGSRRRAGSSSPGLRAQTGSAPRRGDRRRRPIAGSARAAGLGHVEPGGDPHVPEEPAVPGPGRADRLAAVLAAELGDPPVRPQQQPADHAAEPDQHHLEPAGQGGACS